MDIKLNAFVQQVKTDFATGKISKQDHDNALRQKGVDPNTYQTQDTSDLTSLKEAGTKLSSASAGASKAEKQQADKPKPRAEGAPQGKTQPPGSRPIGIPLGIDDAAKAAVPGRRTAHGAFGPSSAEALDSLVQHSQNGTGMLQGVTGQGAGGRTAAAGSETRAAARQRLAAMQGEWDSLTAGIGIDVKNLNI